MSSVSPAQFREAMGGYATGLAIVTASTPEGAPVGLTINSLTSVSLQPALISWCLSRSSTSLPAFASATHHAVHVLAQDQQALAERFASRSADRWAGLAWRAGLGQAPLLDGALVHMECALRQLHEAGDHLMLVAEVLRCTRRHDAAPLLYYSGGFSRAAL